MVGARLDRLALGVSVKGRLPWPPVTPRPRSSDDLRGLCFGGGWDGTKQRPQRPCSKAARVTFGVPAVPTLEAGVECGSLPVASGSFSWNAHNGGIKLQTGLQTTSLLSQALQVSRRAGGGFPSCSVNSFYDRLDETLSEFHCPLQWIHGTKASTTSSRHLRV
jgi:hypothetical protein